MVLISFCEGFTFFLLFWGRLLNFFLESFYRFLRWYSADLYLELVLGGFCFFVVAWKNILEIHYF